MWTTVKNNYITILTVIGFMLFAMVVAFLCEDYYRQLVRFSFKFFNGDNIQFFGKNFHLFASNIFVAASSLFISLSFLLIKFSFQPNKLKRICVTVFVFFATTIFITALDSKLLILECTACDDGIRRLTFNEINYDKYFIISLTTGIIYLITKYLLERRRLSPLFKT